MTESEIDVDCGAQKLSVRVLAPTGRSKGGVVIAYGSDGLVDGPHGPWRTMILDYGHAFTSRGFTVVIPDYLALTNTKPGAEVFLQPQNLPRWQRAIECTAEHLRGASTASPSPIGLLGFSLGGHLCLRARASASVLVEFFAPLFVEFGGIGTATTLRHAQIHHGSADVVVAVSNAERIAQILRAEGARTDVFAYGGAGHGFGSETPGDVAARRDAKARAVPFLEAHMS